MLTLTCRIVAIKPILDNDDRLAARIRYTLKGMNLTGKPTVVTDVLRSITSVNVITQQCENTPLREKIKLSISSKLLWSL